MPVSNRFFFGCFAALCLSLMVPLNASAAEAAASCSNNIKMVSDSIQNIRRLASSGLGGDNFFQAAMLDMTIVHNLVPTYVGEFDKFEEMVRDTEEPPMFRIALIHVMSDWRVRTHMLALRELALSESNIFVRQEAITALGWSGQAQHFDALINVWAVEREPIAKAKILLALGSIGNRYEADRVIAAYKGMVKSQLKPAQFSELETAVTYNGTFLTVGQERQLESVFGDALEDPDYRVRVAASDAIALRRSQNLRLRLQEALGQQDGFGPLPGKRSPGVWAEKKIVKMKFLFALGILKNSASEPFLLNFLKKETDQNVLAEGLKTLSILGTLASHQFMGEQLFSKNEFVALAAAEAIGRADARDLKPQLSLRLKSLTDEYARKIVNDIATRL